MSKWFKRIDMLLVFIITLVTCSGCFRVGSGSSSSIGEVSLISAPSTTTIRFMNEGLYVGYLGAQRDFALIVDNGEYAYKKQIQGCGVEKNGQTVGCSSTMAKLVMNYGIKTANYTGISGSENLLIYYVTSDQFNQFGIPGDSWYSYFTSEDFNTSEYSDFQDSDAIRSLSCGTNAVHSSICDYSKDLSNKGYSDKVGNSMLLLFNAGSLYDIITDKDLDPQWKINLTSSSNFDNLTISDATEYYNNLVNSLKGKINVSNTTHTSATENAKPQTINALTSIAELEDLITGRKNVDDYLLLITSDGFIDEKIGNNYYYDKDLNMKNDDLVGEASDPSIRTFQLMLNSLSSFTDNCAHENDAMINFLKSVLQTLFAGSVGTLVGMAAGAGLGALVGSVIPGVGTAVGAGVGALVGAFVGFFSGVAVNKELEKKLLSANGISDTSYCKIIESALTDIELNVPIYTYNIDTAEDNIKAFRDSSMSDTRLREYYSNNYNKCIGQNQYVNVPSGLLSFFNSSGDYSYSYADSCQKEMVSNIVGGFGGSPSLLLYLNGKKADDLYGRVTTELTNEMLSVWGLKTIGDLYNITSTSTREEMSVTLGSAQQVNNMAYCVSESVLADCNGLDTTPIYINNSNYIASFDANKGIKLDFTDVYMNFSKNKTKQIIQSKASSTSLDIAYDQDNNIYYHRRAIANDSNGWNRVTIRYGVEEEQTAMNQVLSDLKTKLQNNINNSYQIQYNSNYYIICDDGSVVGYRLTNNGNLKVVYYNNGEYEYAFYGDSNFDENNYFHNKLLNDSSTSVNSGHDFYIYIKYTIASTGETAYYAYIV